MSMCSGGAGAAPAFPSMGSHVDAARADLRIEIINAGKEESTSSSARGRVRGSWVPWMVAVDEGRRGTKARLIRPRVSWRGGGYVRHGGASVRATQSRRGAGGSKSCGQDTGLRGAEGPRGVVRWCCAQEKN
ncbi:hypothetical protein K438DRAFT_835608 [Mycena galopus ATCC 62051]|nr:hypothetical protein K438DRAFT_835608 [Mycena galopus ATCC 62051]